MTSVAAPVAAPARRFSPESAGFVGVLSLCMAVTALGVDTVLPAYDDIRQSLGLSPGATEVTGLVTFYLAGNSLGLLPAGFLADRYGRRAVMWGGLVLYVAGAVASIMAGSLALMLAARFLWGVAGAGPRVAAMAMIRDAFDGERMAKQMSLVMAVFLLVPAVGPSLSAGILSIGPWQAVFWMCAAAAAVVALLVTQIPETLEAQSRRPLDAAGIWGGIRTVMAAPGILGYLASLAALFGAFIAYLAGSELIIDQTYDLAQWFPAFFGGTALVMLVAMLLNGRVVERLGLPRLLRLVFAANIVAVSLLAVVAIGTGGEPPFIVFVISLSAVLFFQQMLIPNLTAAAMRPLGAVAGTGAAILGMVPGVVGAILAEVVNRQFDGSIRPLAVGFLVASLVAVTCWRWAERRAV